MTQGEFVAQKSFKGGIQYIYMIRENYRTLEEIGYVGKLIDLIPLQPLWVSFQDLLEYSGIKRENLSQQLKYLRKKKRILLIRKSRLSYYQRVQA